MKLAVVIPALDEAEWIAGAVASAVDRGRRGRRCRRWAVVDGTPRIARRPPGHRVIAFSAGSRLRQLQAGARASEGDVLLFLHADTRLAPGFAAAVRRRCGILRWSAGRSSCVSTGGRRRCDSIEWGARLRVALFELPYGDQALFIRRSVLEEIGGIPQAPIMEDLDLVSAMRQSRKARAASPQPATTSARRYLAGRRVADRLARHLLAAGAWTLGADRRARRALGAAGEQRPHPPASAISPDLAAALGAAAPGRLHRPQPRLLRHLAGDDPGSTSPPSWRFRGWSGHAIALVDKGRLGRRDRTA